jgi:hypothetical protein
LVPDGATRDWLSSCAERLCADEEAAMSHMRRLARIAAYLIVLLLAAVWITSAMASLQQPLLDLAKPRVGDAIIDFASFLALSPDGTMRLAHMLAGLKLLTGTYLLAGLAFTVYERARWDDEGDEMIDVALFLSAIATIVAASPVLTTSAGLQAATGELLLCALASGLVMFGRTPDLAPASAGQTAQAQG